MKDTYRVIRIFLASPGDLQDERRLAKEAVDEIDKSIARYLGYRLELMAWEETLPGSGRPQDLINQDLDLCELFIGMMWKKWGTPPAEDGLYSSGFEEEFERSCARRNQTGQPEMTMFFKEIEKGFLDDPGEDLKKVINFQEGLVSKKSIFFKIFQSSSELQKYIREKISQYLLHITEKENQEEESAKSKKPKNNGGQSQDTEPVKSPFSEKGHSFLISFLNKTESTDSNESITPIEVARFRLLSNSITGQGNNVPYLGVHDANILFANRSIEHGAQEIGGLIDCGLKNFSNENTPIWHWLKIYKELTDRKFLAIKSITSSDEDVKVGALKAMKLIGLPLPEDEKYFERELFLTRWLSKNRSNDLKNAAMRYLTFHGKKEDLEVIQSEIDLNNSTTARNSLEAKIGIQLRSNKVAALKTAFTTQFESIDDELLDEVLSVTTKIDETVLKNGIKHRNKQIRLESFRRLRKVKKISTEDINELENDSFVVIRKEITELLLSEKIIKSDKEVKKILIKSNNTAGSGGIFGLARTDYEGEAYYNEYQILKHSELPEKKLLEVIDEEDVIIFPIPYIALCSKYFSNNAELLRKDIDDRYKVRFRNYLEQCKNKGAAGESIRRVEKLEEFFRNKMLRSAIDILCLKNKIEDLSRIRENMNEKLIRSSEVEIEYMRKNGEWKDISIIANASKDYNRLNLLKSHNDYSWDKSKAETIYTIGKSRLRELLKVEMPTGVYVELLKICSIVNFSKLPDNDILFLLNKDSAESRKITSLKCIQALKKSRLKNLLSRYENEEDYRYYNVRVWLDFGVSVSKIITRKAISKLYRD